MSSLNDSVSQKEYLKKYLSQDVKKKKKKKTSANALKRSQVIDDDIDLKSMRPLDDDEIELYQMDEDAPQIAGIVDERPPEVKAQEQYNSKRWKVFGGEDGVNVVDNIDKNQQSVSDKLSNMSKRFGDAESSGKSGHSIKMEDTEKKDPKHKSVSLNKSSSLLKDSDVSSKGVKKEQSTLQEDSDLSPPRTDNKISHQKYDSDPSPARKNDPTKYLKHDKYHSDSDASPPRRSSRKGTSEHSDKASLRKEQRIQKCESDSDNLPPRKDREKSSKYKNKFHKSPPRKDKAKKSAYQSNSDSSPPRKDRAKSSKYKSDSDNSPPRKDRGRNSKYQSDSNNSPPRKDRGRSSKYQSDSDNSLPRKDKKSVQKQISNSCSVKSTSIIREKEKLLRKKYPGNTPPRRDRRKSSSDSDSSPPRRVRNKSPAPNRKSDSPGSVKRKRSSRSSSPPMLNKPLLQLRKPNTNVSPRLSRRDLMNKKLVKRHFSDSDDSPPRRRSNSFRLDESASEFSPSRKKSSLEKEKPHKKVLYKPNDSSSSDETSRKKKMKTTLDGKQAGLQDAKQLKKELSDLRMREDAMFSQLEASVSGVGAAAIKRDRKTGQVRDLEKEKEAQKDKEAKASVVNEKYNKWGKGLKQVEDAAERAAEALKVMNKPLARYAGDEDLDNFLKAQEREGDPMLDYIKQKQSEATPLSGVKPLYQGSFNPNRFGVRPGHRWDGVVRSNGYEKEWFTHKNARKARDEEAYKWSTSDM